MPAQPTLPSRRRFPSARAPSLACLAGAALLAGAVSAQEPALREIRYATTREDFPNPERGWYRYRELGTSGGFDFAVRAAQGSLVFLKIRADAWRSGPLPQALLDRLQQAFDQARRDGVKLIPRVAYNDGPEAGCAAKYGCDAPKSVILGHIAQLAPIWNRNRDVLSHVDPGFIGGWGEWHTSAHGLDNRRDRTDILFALLDALDPSRMAVIRYPAFKREIFGGSYTAETALLGPDNAFDRSRLARVGHLNDCLVSGDDDVGTYQHSGWARSREVAYIGGESRFAPFGGETCAEHALGECAGALREMAALHIDYLNHDFHGGVIQRWRDQGCHDTIGLKLGHRLALDWARLPDSVKPGGVLRLAFAVRNHGFGELWNARDLEAVLYREGAGARLEAAVLPVDPRRWAGGSADTVEAALSVPAGLPEGVWRLGLRLADRDSVLGKDPRYAVRFANAGVWQAATGINDLKADLVVSLSAPGRRDAAFTRFAPVDQGPVRLRARPRGPPGPFLLRRDGTGRLVLRTEGAAAVGGVTVRLRRLDGTVAGEWRLAGAGPWALPLREGAFGIATLEAEGPRGRAAWTLSTR